MLFCSAYPQNFFICSKNSIKLMQYFKLSLLASVTVCSELLLVNRNLFDYDYKKRQQHLVIVDKHDVIWDLTKATSCHH